MIVDDSQIVTELTAFLLENLGYETVQFTEGRMAIEYLDDTESPYPDLIVCDHYLGTKGDIRKTGYRILNKLEQYGIHIPVVIMSGNSNDRIIDKYFELGVDAYVCKDQDNFIDDLEEEIEYILNKQQKE